MTLLNSRIQEIAQTVLNGGGIDRDEALSLIQLQGQDRYDLFYWANRIRLARVGPTISLCGITSSRIGRCSQDCRFCAQSTHFPTATIPASTEPEEMLTAARQALDRGAHCFGIVSSGLKLTDTEINRLGPVLKQIASGDKLTCCASLGCLTEPQARKLYDFGVRRYNHNLETSRRFFPRVVTTHTYDDRLSTIRSARNAGMQLCCGGIIGLGENLEDRVDLALALRELEVDSIPLNFLDPIAGTPFANNESVSPMTALQTIAMFRFVLPDKSIKIAGGREKCLRDLQSWMFYAGANSTMVGSYLTTAGRNAEDDLQMLKDLELPL